MVEGQVREHPNCFGCGDLNPIGLGLDIRLEDGFLVTEFTPKEEHQGWPDIVHSGITTALLYEVLKNFPYHQGIVDHDEEHGAPVSPTCGHWRYRSYSIMADGAIWTRDEGLGVPPDEQGQLIAAGKATLVELSHDQLKRSEHFSAEETHNGLQLHRFPVLPLHLRVRYGGAP